MRQQRNIGPEVRTLDVLAEATVKILSISHALTSMVNARLFWGKNSTKLRHRLNISSRFELTLTTNRGKYAFMRTYPADANKIVHEG
jgi:hypothetical protein